MGFIERITALARNNNINKVEVNKGLLSPFTSNSLKRKSLNQDTYQTSTAVEKQGLLPKNFENNGVDSNVFDAHLALKEPEKFIATYANSRVLNEAIRKNPEIAKILKENGLPVQYNLDNVTSIVKSHLIPTTKTAQGIYKNLGHSENEKSYVHLTQAALLHDIGKAFIPSEILNKNGFLTPKERRIIELHNQLSYEILKTTNLSPAVAQYALEHHNYDGKVVQSQENQSITVADIYCALREKRPYKKAMNDITAKTILYDMGTKGKFDTRYICKLNS